MTPSDWFITTSVFEHKLDSPVGPEQFQRYLALPNNKKWKLAVLARRRLEIATSVCGSASFVCPREAGAPPHFLWQDVHDVVARSTAHLACEFNEYLEALGLVRFDWAGLGDPFIDQAAAEELRSLYETPVGIYAGCRRSLARTLLAGRRCGPGTRVTEQSGDTGNTFAGILCGGIRPPGRLGTLQ